VPIIFVCFVVKKADGLRTPCGKYTAGDSFLEITLNLKLFSPSLFQTRFNLIYISIVNIFYYIFPD